MAAPAGTLLDNREETVDSSIEAEWDRAAARQLGWGHVFEDDEYGYVGVEGKSCCTADGDGVFCLLWA